MPFPNLSTLAATGAPPGPAQREVMANPDLMVAVLTAIYSGENWDDSKKACRMAARWCAAHKGACDDDDTWRQLRELVFPDTAGTSPPYPEYIKSNKQWFRMLCQGLRQVMRSIEESRVVVERHEQEYQQELARVREIYERTGERAQDPVLAQLDARRRRGKSDLVSDEVCKLQLKVILWDRWRKGLEYMKPSPDFFAKRTDYYWTALTWEEMRAQLDALEEEEDDGADGPMHGDSGRR